MLISATSDAAWAEIACVTGALARGELKDARQQSSVSWTFKKKSSANIS